MMDQPWTLKTRVEHAARPGLTWRRAIGLLLGIGAAFLALHAWWAFTPSPAVQSGPRVVDIPLRLGLLTMSQRLDEAGVIRSRLGFVLLAWATGSARSLKAGEYEVPQGATTVTVLRLLESGKVLHHPVLLREGGTLAELARAVEAERLASAEEILRVAHDPAFLRSVGVEADSLEGYLFPDSYQLVKGMTPEEILGRMLTRMRDQISPETLELAKARDLTLHRLLTLASIIEREAVDRKEMPLISGVFWNRLKRDIPLQADPTVQYALAKQGHALTRADLQVDSPFNTYRYVGLPPGPIASPGREAIDAAVRPAATDYLYFVAMNERQHKFSTSLAEHNAAVARYRSSKPR
jgi:peptidoglycan lytic transglycosylase G